jgi:hypothetical protein
MKIDNDNFFDIAEAIHCYCTLNHDGKSSELYSILSQSDFKPSPFWSESKVINENEFYNEITENNVSELFNELQNYLNTRND